MVPTSSGVPSSSGSSSSNVPPPPRSSARRTSRAAGPCPIRCPFTGSRGRARLRTCARVVDTKCSQLLRTFVASAGMVAVVMLMADESVPKWIQYTLFVTVLFSSYLLLFPAPARICDRVWQMFEFMGFSAASDEVDGLTPPTATVPRGGWSRLVSFVTSRRGRLQTGRPRTSSSPENPGALTSLMNTVRSLGTLPRTADGKRIYPTNTCRFLQVNMTMLFGMMASFYNVVIAMYLLAISNTNSSASNSTSSSSSSSTDVSLDSAVAQMGPEVTLLLVSLYKFFYFGFRLYRRRKMALAQAAKQLAIDAGSTQGQSTPPPASPAPSTPLVTALSLSSLQSPGSAPSGSIGASVGASPFSDSSSSSSNEEFFDPMRSSAPSGEEEEEESFYEVSEQIP